MRQPVKLTVALVQTSYNSADLAGHVARLKDVVRENRECDLIVFPELILHGHPSDERPAGFLYRRMKAWHSSVSEEFYGFVKDVDARVIIGEVRRRGERFYNVATYVDRHGVDRYAKTHVHWTEQFVPGRRLKSFQTPFGKVGVNICFDGAFSEVWRALALTGVPVIANISAVPATFPVRYMWRRLRGAAIFNEVFVLYANRAGDFFSGHSAVFGPRGDLLASAGMEETVLRVRLDLEEVTRWRREETIYPNRRPLLYREIVRRRPPTPSPPEMG
jgi:predicted amidohydrolase